MKAKNGVDDKYQRKLRMRWRPCEIDSRLGAMENYDSSPAWGKQPLIMMYDDDEDYDDDKDCLSVISALG